MRKYMILGAALALGTVCAFPGAKTLGVGGEALAAKGERNQGERANAGGRQGRGNRAAAAPALGKNGAGRNAAGTQRPVVVVSRDVERRSFQQPRARDRGFRRPAPRAAHQFNERRFCMRPRRIERRLYQQGWNIESFRRTGSTFQASARNRQGQRHALTIDRCDGHIISAQNLEPRRKSKLKRALRSIRKTFKKLF